MASFVTTWMDSEAEALIAETQAVNIVDTSQYPQCTEMEQRYVVMPTLTKDAMYMNMISMQISTIFAAMLHHLLQTLSFGHECQFAAIFHIH